MYIKETRRLLQLRRGGFSFEVLDTINALATFNVLAEEGRQVVAFLLTLDPYDASLDALYETLDANAESDGDAPLPDAIASPDADGSPAKPPAGGSASPTP